MIGHGALALHLIQHLIPRLKLNFKNMGKKKTPNGAFYQSYYYQKWSITPHFQQKLSPRYPVLEPWDH